MIPFPSIKQFRDIVKHIRTKASFIGLDEQGKAIYNPNPVYPKLTFNGTCKLHGTNAAIVYGPEGIYYQSRGRVLTQTQDNAGFMAHMEQHLDTVAGLGAYIAKTNALKGVNHTIVVYGEWCGGAIQKGVAINGLPKMFVIFAILVNNQWVDIPPYTVDTFAKITNIQQFQTWDIEIDFKHPELSQNQLKELTNEVEACCPVGKTFGVTGIGEGIVWRCTSDPSSEYWFKVKGEKHSVSKVKTLASIDVATVNQINDFVAMTVTEARLEQGLHNLINEQLKPFDMTSMGDFIRWIYHDVLKEESDILQTSGIDYKQLSKPLATVARSWFTNQLNTAVFNQAI